ncbi:homeobox protein 2-like [Colletes gigas]|uniref:homeobox protein 2-like n=1 Tax=Colletes gigas TaxID=935657 RepID=UPI001C9A9EBC|nr:homeobox protein 2-like [Colletes gigas]
MCDCFNMAYQDKTDALQLNIKVNSENLTPIPQKYNTGSLRIPADPSWPKIPQRKLADDINNGIKLSCIDTLTGTPEKSHTIVQTPLNQSSKSTITKDSAYSSFNCQRITSSMHTLKRLPGYIDPRFKNRVTNIKRNQVTSIDTVEKKANGSDLTSFTESLHNEEIAKSIPEQDINLQQIKMQETEKPHGTRRMEKINTRPTLHNYELYEKKNNCIQNSKGNNNVNNNQEPILEQKNSANSTTSKSLGNNIEDIDNNKIKEMDKCVKNTSCYNYIPKSTMNDVDTQVNITPLPVQENNGQLFFVLDKKLQSHPLNAIHVDTIPLPQEYLKQCYNLQVPVLTYQNIPMQIPTIGTNNVIQQCSSNSEHRKQSDTAFIMKEAEQCVNSPNTESLKQITQVTLNQMQNINKSLEKNIYDTEKNNSLKVQSTISDKNRENCLNPNDSSSITKISVNANIPEKLESTQTQQKQQESSDSEYYIPSTIKRNMHNNVFQHLKAKKTVYNTSGEETTDSEFIPRRNIQKKECNEANRSTVKTNRINIDNYDQENVISNENDKYPRSNIIISDQNQPYQEEKTAPHEVKTKNKSEQNLPCTKDECTKKLGRNSEPHIAYKQKKASAKFSRKARSYFQKNSHSALVDSDYTLVWPNCQHNKCSQMTIHKFHNHKTKRIGHHSNVKLPIHEKNGNTQTESNLNFIEQNHLQHDGDIHLCHKVIRNLSKSGLKNNKCKCEISPRSNTIDTIESPKGISPKTQELLNKSYWEYYNKLRHKIENTDSIEQQYLCQLAIDTQEGKKENADETYDKELQNPELKTLQQCSTLSSMINKALDSNHQSNIVETDQLHYNENIKSLSAPMADIQNTNANNMALNFTDGEPMHNIMRYKRNKEKDKQFLELKSIIFFGGMMYILVIFLPMLYEYFYHEEYDNYENLNYLEFIVDYVLSSFQEAFGGIFNGVKQIFFYPHACKKCNNIA